MLRGLGSELHRLRYRWMPRILLVSIVGAGSLFYELVYLTLNGQLRLLREGKAPPSAIGPGGVEAAIRQVEQTLQQVRPDHVADFGVPVVSGLGAVLLIVFAASHVGTEFGWGTLRTLLAGGLSRGQFLAAKLVSLVLFALLFAILGVAATIAASYAVATQAGLDTGGLDLARVLSASWRTVYAFLPYLALATLIALWSRSSGAGIAAGLVIYFAEGLVMGLLISFNPDYATIANLGLSRNVQSLSRLSVNASGTTPSPSAATLPDQTQAFAVLLVWTAVFIGLAFWRLRSRDVTLA